MGKPPGSTHAVARDALEAYKQARLAFVNSLNEMLRKDDPSLDAALLDGECLALLHRPLAQDIVPGIQTSALAAMRAPLARDRAGDVLATPETLGKIVSSLSHADPPSSSPAAGVARALASKREAHVRALFDAAVFPLRRALDALNPEILEAAAKCAVAVAQASPWAAERLLDAPPARAARAPADETRKRRRRGNDTRKTSSTGINPKGSRGKQTSDPLECLCSASANAKTSLSTRATMRASSRRAPRTASAGVGVVRDADCAGGDASCARRRPGARRRRGAARARARRSRPPRGWPGTRTRWRSPCATPASSARRSSGAASAATRSR